MKSLIGTLSRLGSCKVMVIGDLMLDSYTVGKARRISPEAPVAVVQVQHQEHRPGGAGNVVLNLISLGAEVVCIGRIGNDAYGAQLSDALSKEGVSSAGLFVQKDFQTPVKNRIIADNQQIVRVDHEVVTPIPEMLEQKIIESLPQLMQDVKVVAISDYGKGFLSRTLLSAIIEQARLRKLCVIADPKGVDFTKYAGSTIIKPNMSETIAASGLPHDSPLEHMAAKVLESAQAEVLMVTRSEAGISLFYRNGNVQNFPVRMREVKDVTGAGDTVLAMLASAIANGLTIPEAVQLSNIAAGIAIERFGCARISLSDMALRLLDYDVVNKVFDEEHHFALQEALKGRSFALLSLSGKDGLTPSLFASIRKLSSREGWSLLVHVRDHAPDENFVHMLSSLREIDFIIVNSDNMRRFCELIEPNEIFTVENGSLQQVDAIHSLLL